MKSYSFSEFTQNAVLAQNMIMTSMGRLTMQAHLKSVLRGITDLDPEFLLFSEIMISL